MFGALTRSLSFQTETLPNSGELKRGLAVAMKETRSLRKKIEAERHIVEQQLAKLQQQYERLKQKVVELALQDKDDAAAALNDKLAALKQEIELAEARLDGHAAALRSIEQSQQQSDEVLSHVVLVERAWREGKREGLRSLIRGLVKKVDVRADEVLIWIYAMPQSAVCEIEPEVAPTGLIRIPGEHCRLTRLAA